MIWTCALAAIFAGMPADDRATIKEARTRLDTFYKQNARSLRVVYRIEFHNDPKAVAKAIEGPDLPAGVRQSLREPAATRPKEAWFRYPDYRCDSLEESDPVKNDGIVKSTNLVTKGHSYGWVQGVAYVNEGAWKGWGPFGIEVISALGYHLPETLNTSYADVLGLAVDGLAPATVERSQNGETVIEVGPGIPLGFAGGRFGTLGSVSFRFADIGELPRRIEFVRTYHAPSQLQAQRRNDPQFKLEYRLQFVECSDFRAVPGAGALPHKIAQSGPLQAGFLQYLVDAYEANSKIDASTFASPSGSEVLRNIDGKAPKVTPPLAAANANRKEKLAQAVIESRELVESSMPAPQTRTPFPYATVLYGLSAILGGLGAARWRTMRREGGGRS